MVAEITAGLLGGLLALGGWERVQRDRAHQAIPTRIHVNGTRGKSTVTRLIAAALRASGCPALAKTTGTAARLIGLDGSDVPIRRRTVPSIREQLWFLREARRQGANAVVIECMAIDPDLQAVSERDMVKATIGVITNARADHADLMGATADAVARALARTVPAGGLVVLGEALPVPVFAEAARHLGTRVVQASRRNAESLAATPLPGWVLDNLAVALEVTRALGIADAVAWPAMLAAPEDPGAATVVTRTVAGRTCTFIDGAAANDPESLQMLLTGMAPEGRRLFVFNHRADRPLRLRQFAGGPVWKGPQARVLVTGDSPDFVSRRLAARAIGAARLGFVAWPRLGLTVRAQLIDETAIRSVVVCGNTRRLDVAALITAISDPGPSSERPEPSGTGD